MFEPIKHHKKSACSFVWENNLFGFSLFIFAKVIEHSIMRSPFVRSRRFQTNEVVISTPQGKEQYICAPAARIAIPKREVQSATVRNSVQFGAMLTFAPGLRPSDFRLDDTACAVYRDQITWVCRKHSACVRSVRVCFASS